MFMALATRLVVLFYCCATADILTKHLQHCCLFFIVGNSQVSVYRTIGPTLVCYIQSKSSVLMTFLKVVQILVRKTRSKTSYLPYDDNAKIFCFHEYYCQLFKRCP